MHHGYSATNFQGGQTSKELGCKSIAVSLNFIIFRWPFRALDVSIQAQVGEFINGVNKKQKDLTFLFHPHDLSMVKYISDRIGCKMNRGNYLISGLLIEVI